MRQDRLWYFTTVRRIATNEVVANNFYKDGRPGIEDQWIYNFLGRLTWQANAKTKVTGVFRSLPEVQRARDGRAHRSGHRRAAARMAARAVLHHAGQGDLDPHAAGFSSRAVIRATSSTTRAGTSRASRRRAGRAEWFSQTGHEELVGYGTVTPYRYWNGLNTPANGTDPRKHVLATSLSYVTGTHCAENRRPVGLRSRTSRRGDLNGDLIQLYRNGRPDSVRVYNTPREAKEFLNADLGIFAQDSWRIQRLTLNYGIRLEYFNGEITEQDAPAGRFVPARHFDEDPVHAVLDRRHAALRRRLRPVRQRPDGAEGQRQQVHGRPDARLRAALQPVLVAERHPDLDRPEQRRHRAGQRDRTAATTLASARRF